MEEKEGKIPLDKFFNMLMGKQYIKGIGTVQTTISVRAVVGIFNEFLESHELDKQLRIGNVQGPHYVKRTFAGAFEDFIDRKARQSEAIDKLKNNEPR